MKTRRSLRALLDVIEQAPTKINWPIKPVFTASRKPDEYWPWALSTQQRLNKPDAEAVAVIHVGDSHTYSIHASQWARFGWRRSPAELSVCDWTKSADHSRLNGWWLACNQQGKQCSWTATWGLESAQLIAGGKNGLCSLQTMLQHHKPRIVMILIGSNDLKQGITAESYLSNMATIYAQCLHHSAIPVVQTIPPMVTDKGDLHRAYNQGLINLAARLHLPLLDIHRSFVERRPGNSWMGSLITSDGIHLTSRHSKGPATEEKLNNSGYLLLCWLKVHKLAAIRQALT